MFQIRVVLPLYPHPLHFPQGPVLLPVVCVLHQLRDPHLDDILYSTGLIQDANVGTHICEVGEDDRLISSGHLDRRRLNAGAVHPANELLGAMGGGGGGGGRGGGGDGGEKRGEEEGTSSREERRGITLALNQTSLKWTRCSKCST